MNNKKNIAVKEAENMITSEHDEMPRELGKEEKKELHFTSITPGCCNGACEGNTCGADDYEDVVKELDENTKDNDFH
jgi:predicted methyltransferase